jgi:hypothetical protein
MASTGRALSSAHTWRAIAGAAAGSVTGVDAVLHHGLPPDQAIVLGWQTGTTMWGYINGLAKNLGGPYVIGGVTGFTALEGAAPGVFGQPHNGLQVMAGGFLGWLTRQGYEALKSPKK